MRYAVGMTPGLRLNTATAHTWAAVVSGTAWKRHTLAPTGELTAEYTRGPLIVWATRPGEEEALQADGPAVSALEDRIDRLNTAQVFEQFKWAARGRVRPSVRWKTGSRPRRLRKLEALEDLRYEVVMAERRAAGRRGFISRPHSRSARVRRTETKFYKQEESFDNLCQIAPDIQIIEEGLAVPCPSERIRKLFEEYRSRIKIYGPIASYWRARASKIEPDFLRYLLLTKDSEALRTYIPYRLIARKPHNKLYRKALEKILAVGTLYRAHLTRRVKPAPRRHRIRRPLHSRPRPPSAPLAPPVS